MSDAREHMQREAPARALAEGSPAGRRPLRVSAPQVDTFNTPDGVRLRLMHYRPR